MYSIPVRGLSNFAYCPRLFYLQQVEGIFRDDQATAEGRAIHKVVDEPTRLSPDGDVPKTMRSLHLDSEKLMINGVLDIAVEAEGGIEIVDYKRGSAHRDDSDHRIAKEWDIVQVRAQAILAEEHGFSVKRAFIFYNGDKKRVQVDIGEDAKASCLKVIESAHDCVARGEIPPPLKNDWRCNYCSAYPICLPNESDVWANNDKEATEDLSEPLRPPMVDDSTREILLVHSAGSTIGLSSGKVQIRVKGVLQTEIPLEQLGAVYIYGAVQLTAHFLAACIEGGISIGHFGAAGRFLGITHGLGTTGTLARRGQYRTADHPGHALTIAREMIATKIHNQRVLLMRNGVEVAEQVKALANLRMKASHAESADSLRGIEGAAAACYFSVFNKILKVDDSGVFDFNGRNRRPPRDPVNALLSLGYSMLVKELTGICTVVGLDPYVGVLHSSRLGRPALALDLMEEFRPLIVDSIVVTLINRSELTQEDFEITSKGVFLKEGSRRIFWEAWFKRLDTDVKHPIFGYKMKYRRMLEVQVRQLWRVFAGEASSYSGFRTK